MTMAANYVHPRSCANDNVLAVGYVCKQPDIPIHGSGRPTFDAHLPETVPEQPGEPAKTNLQGEEGVEEACAAASPNHPSTPSLLRYGGGTAERYYCWA